MSTAKAAWDLTPEQELYRVQAESFADGRIRPWAAKFEEDGGVPRELIREIGQQGFLGTNVDPSYGGGGLDHVRIGLLHYAMGRASSSLQSLLTVHGMVCEVLQRWGSREQ